MPLRSAAALAAIATITVLATAPVAAQDLATPPSSSDRPFEIQDNSFFVEEAFNQEPGVVQTIVGAAFLQDSGWAATVTQEWPAPSMRHQLSFTVAAADVDGARGPGDLAVNYRYQLLEEGPGRPAVSPRATLIVPTGNAERGLGTGAAGLQFNLPVSKQAGDVYLHGNAGVTWYPSVKPVGTAQTAGLAAVRARSLTSPFVAGSAIYRLRPMFHLMLESVLTGQQAFDEGFGRDRRAVGILSPGVRTGWNHGDTQYVAGAALPVTWSGGRHDAALFLYFSYETRFWSATAP